MMRASRRALRVALGYGALVGLVALAALPFGVALEAGSRGALIRAAAGLVLAVALGQVLGAARRRVEAQPPSAFDRALVRWEPEPSLPREFRELFDEVRFGRARDGYFRRILFPRLVALAAGRPDGPGLTEPPRPRLRRWLGLGPTLPAIGALLAHLEERP